MKICGLKCEKLNGIFVRLKCEKLNDGKILSFINKSSL
jgi:hypothetical protein